MNRLKTYSSQSESIVTSLTQLISTYMNLLDEYDRLSTTYAVGYIGFIGAIVAGIGVVYSNTDSGKFSPALLVLLLLIPAAVTLFIYEFSMIMRKVALYRGYLRYLEKRLCEETGYNDYVFNGLIVKRCMDSGFLTNKYGPIVMFIFLLIILIGSYYLSYELIGSMKLDANDFFKYTTALVVYAILVLTYIAICGKDLITNGKAADDVYKICNGAL